MRRAVPILIAALFLAGTADAHSWYTGRESPHGFGGCCSGVDCGEIRPEQLRCGPDGCRVWLNAGDTPTVRTAGWYWFPGAPEAAEDMAAHVCFVPAGREQATKPEGFIGVLRCVFWGGVA